TTAVVSYKFGSNGLGHLANRREALQALGLRSTGDAHSVYRMIRRERSGQIKVAADRPRGRRKTVQGSTLVPLLEAHDFDHGQASPTYSASIILLLLLRLNHSVFQNYSNPFDHLEA